MSKKLKVTANKAENVEQLQPPIAPQRPMNIDNLPSEELAMLLNQQYQQLIQAQNNINAINIVLGKRKTK